MSIKVLEDKIEVVQKEIKPPISKRYKKLRRRKLARKFNIQVTEVPERTETMDKRKIIKEKTPSEFSELKEVCFLIEGAKEHDEHPVQSIHTCAPRHILEKLQDIGTKKKS